MSASPSAAAEGSEDSSNILQIVSDGDVILMVGPEQGKIQVSSHFLKHISPVFWAMLDAPMNEGEALRNKQNDEAIEISLPEDDFNAMRQMLQILYGADLNKEDVTFHDIMKIATLADKYDTIKRLEAFGTLYLRIHSNGDPDFDEHWDNLVVAHKLKNDWGFFETSRALLKVDGSYLQWAIDTPDKTLGMQLAWALDDLRSCFQSLKYDEDKEELGLCLYCFNKSANTGRSFNRMFKECQSYCH